MATPSNAGMAAIIAPEASKPGHSMEMDIKTSQRTVLDPAGFRIPEVAGHRSGAHYSGGKLDTNSSSYEHPIRGPVPRPVFSTRGRTKHQAALRLSFSRARAGVWIPVPLEEPAGVTALDEGTDHGSSLL